MKIFKTLFLLLIGVIVVGGAFLYLSRNMLAERAIEYYARQSLGVDVRTESVNLKLLDSEIMLEGVEIANPDGYDHPHLARFHSIFLDYDFRSLLQPPFHAYLLEIDLEELVLNRNAEGKLNVEGLIPEKEPVDPEEATQEVEELDEEVFLIDILLLSIDHVVYIDDYKEDETKTRSISVGMKNYVYEEVDNLNDVIRVILVEAILRAGLTNLEEMIEPLTEELSEMISRLPGGLQSEYEEKLRDEVHRLGEKSDKYLERLEEYIESVPEEIEGFLDRFLP